MQTTEQVEHSEELEDFYEDDPNINLYETRSYMSDTVRDDDSTTIAKQKKMMKDFKNLDKGYRQISRLQGSRYVNIDLYVTSYVPGSKIRDAITGSRFRDFRVGTKEEDYFFKVKLATGELGRDSGHLFFDTPSQCEKHLKLVLTDTVKQRWKDKYDAYEYSSTLLKNRSKYPVKYRPTSMTPLDTPPATPPGVIVK